MLSVVYKKDVSNMLEKMSAIVGYSEERSQNSPDTMQALATSIEQQFRSEVLLHVITVCAVSSPGRVDRIGPL